MTANVTLFCIVWEPKSPSRKALLQSLGCVRHSCGVYGRWLLHYRKTVVPYAWFSRLFIMILHQIIPCYHQNEMNRYTFEDRNVISNYFLRARNVQNEKYACVPRFQKPIPRAGNETGDLPFIGHSVLSLICRGCLSRTPVQFSFAVKKVSPFINQVDFSFHVACGSSCHFKTVLEPVVHLNFR